KDLYARGACFGEMGYPGDRHLGAWHFPVPNGSQTSAPLALLPDRLLWVSPPNNPRLRFAWILGNEQNTGSYLLRATAGF
ncbi:MAG TPA: hypothetical protein VMS23_03330, partial [Terrimicrobiaceae bacterium]|nr:hypothetical protein [Terrimicrobiaceae bacterium]